MTTLKQHQEAMVQLLANGSGIPASASRLAHAMHDVLEALERRDSVGKIIADGLRFKREQETTPGLNDKALAEDIKAVRPKQVSAEQRVKQLENTVKQLRETNSRLRRELQGCRVTTELAAKADDTTTDSPSAVKLPEQSGVRKEDTEVCDHAWRDTGREFYCKYCGAHPSDLPESETGTEE